MNSEPRILYVDDESDLLNLAASFFEDEDMSIDTCTDFNEALNKVRNRKYDLIISDARMPTGTGKDLLNIIREEKVFSGKCILLTGNLDYQTTKDEYPYDQILFKPLRFQDLVDHAKKILDS